MAAIFRQLSPQTSGANPVVDTYALGNVVIGSLLVACIFDFNATTTLGITGDSQGNVWTPVGPQQVSNGVTYQVWTAIAKTTGADTVTMTSSTPSFPIGYIAEYTNFGASVFTQQILTNGSAVAPAIPTITFNPKNTSEILISLVHGNGTPSFAAPFTSRNSGTNIGYADDIISSLAAATLSGTWSTSGISTYGVSLSPSAITSSISGNAGTAGATVSWSGTSSGSVTADGSGNYTIPGLANGSYTVTPSKTGFVFSPVSSNQTVAGLDIAGVNFTATASATVYSVPDCRVAPFGPNSSRTVQGTKIYDVQISDNASVPGKDSRSSVPADSRVSPNIPQNSRAPGTFGPGE